MAAKTAVATGSPAPGTPLAATRPAEVDDRLVSSGRFRRFFMSPEVGSGAAALLVFIAFSIAAPAFASREGIGNFLDPASTLGIMAVSVALLMIGGEFDLSSGVMIGSTALVTALITTQLNTNIWFGVLGSLVFALVVGFLNGLVVHRTKLPSFIITLGTYFMLWGLNYAVTTKLTSQVTVSGISVYSGFDSAKALLGSSVRVCCH